MSTETPEGGAGLEDGVSGSDVGAAEEQVVEQPAEDNSGDDVVDALRAAGTAMKGDDEA